MRYILDNNGYVELCSKTHIECNGRGCTEYTGTIPSGYNSLEDWVTNANIRAYKVVEGNLVYDAARDKELQEIYNKEAEDHKPLCKKDLYEVDEKINQNDVSLKTQYVTDYAAGKIVRTNNTMPLSPDITIKNISCYAYDKIKLIATNKNMLPNTATSKTISGVNFKQNTDRSITIAGKSAEAIEYDIAGSSINTSPIFVFKKGFNYYLSSNGYQIKFYNYDGTDRTEVYSSTGGKISFDLDKKVTHITLYIPKGTTVNTTVYPQLELDSATDYVTHEEHSLEIDFSSSVDEGLFPSDTLYPSDDLFPRGTEIDYIKILENLIYTSENGTAKYLKDGFLSVLENTNFIYSTEDNYLEATYYTNVLKVDDLGFLQGKATTTNQFKILKDGSIEAHNGYFSGTIEVTGGSISNANIDGYVNSDTLAKNYSSNDDLKTAGKTIISGGNITTGDIKSNNYVANETGTKLNLSDGSIDTKNFKVSSDGTVSANKGLIGGWEISNIELYKKFADRYNFEIRSDRAANEPTLLVYDTAYDTYNFYVRPDGYLFARDADVGGKINASTGNIGNWAISDGSIYGYNEGYETWLTPYGLMAKPPYDTIEQIRWYDVIFKPSDKRLKNSIVDIEEKYEQFYNDLKPKTFKYNEFVRPDDFEKIHFGFVAQDIVESAEKNDLKDLSLIFGEKYLKLEKEEIIALNTWQIQKMKNKLDEALNRIETLENKIKELESDDNG